VTVPHRLRGAQAEGPHRDDGPERAPGGEHGERDGVDPARRPVRVEALQQPGRQVVDGEHLRHCEYRVGDLGDGPGQKNAVVPTASVSSTPGARSVGIVTP